MAPSVIKNNHIYIMCSRRLVYKRTPLRYISNSYSKNNQNILKRQKPVTDKTTGIHSHPKNNTLPYVRTFMYILSICACACVFIKIGLCSFAHSQFTSKHIVKTAHWRNTDWAMFFFQIDIISVSYTHLDVYKRQVLDWKISAHFLAPGKSSAFLSSLFSRNRLVQLYE